MPNYKRIQIIGYGSVTSEPTQVLQANTNSPYRKDAETRARTLCDVAEWTRGTFGGALGGPDTLKVFVAPEFYFRFGGPAADEEILRDSYPNGELLLPNIAEEILLPFFTTPQYADWLIVPGTMFWHKSAAESNSTHATYFNTVLTIRGGTGGELTPDERARNAQPCQVPVMARSSANQKSLMSTIDYAPDAPGEQAAGWDAALNPMFQEILDDWEWWRWHAFTVRDLCGPTGKPIVFGLEVCLEHIDSTDDTSGLGVLRTLERNYSSHCKGPVPQIDVHLVTSCGMDLQDGPGVAARVGGIAAICDGMQPGAPDATWPNMNCERVDSITTDRRRVTSEVGEPVFTHQLPANLQVGVDSQLHNPPDAVGVSQPMALPV